MKEKGLLILFKIFFSVRFQIEGNEEELFIHFKLCHNHTQQNNIVKKSLVL